MRRVLTLIMMLVVCGAAVAQPGSRTHDNRQKNMPPAGRNQLEFRARHGETFMVYLDGHAVNKVPQGYVKLSDVAPVQHEVIVVLGHPQQRAVVFSLGPVSLRAEVLVSYERQGDRVDVEPKGCHLSYYPVPTMVGGSGNWPPEPPVAAPQPEPTVWVASEEEVASMVMRLKAQSFDSDRMALCRAMVPTAHLLSSQIARMAETFDFNTSQVEFLIFAFPYCMDPDNYYKTTDVLTFSNDKKSILDLINANRH